VCAAWEKRREGGGLLSYPTKKCWRERKRRGEAVTAKIDTGGRISKTAAAGSVGGARGPVDSNKSTSEPPMRTRSEEGGLGSFTDGKVARAAAMARRPALQSMTRACEGKGRRSSLGVCEGRCGEAMGAFI
jgi:hypothetical protein